MAEVIIEDYQNYTVTDTGIVYNNKTGRVLKTDINNCGYLRVTLCKNNKPRKFFIHRLVAKYFLGLPDCGLDQVNHKDGNKQNNCVVNLEWCNQSLNQIHAHATGLQPRVTKVTEGTVRVICQYLSDEIPVRSIIRSLDVSRDIVQDIKRRKTWLHISESYNF